MTGNLQEVLDLRRWRETDFDEPDRALLAYAEKFTVESDRTEARDIQRLRDVGFTDSQILDITLCAGYRHYITRVADATGIEVDTELGISSVLTEAYTHARGNPPSSQDRSKEVKQQKNVDSLRDGPWIKTLDKPEDDPSLAVVWSTWRDSCGIVPGLLLALSLRPLAAEKLSSFWRLACFGGSRMSRLRETWVGGTIASLIPSSWLLAIYRGLLFKCTGNSGENSSFPSWRESQLPDQEKTVLKFAEHITKQASSITQGDVDQLRKVGLTDPEILDVIVAAALLNCLGRMANALGVLPDPFDSLSVGKYGKPLPGGI